MDLAILSDTHVPGQADGVPDQFRERIREADHVVHAGDFGSYEALRDVRELATDLTAVYGNADPGDIDLPAVASVTTDGVTVVVSHGIVTVVERAVSSSEGVVFDRDDWLDAVADTARVRAETAPGSADAADRIVGVGGHTHEVEDEVHNQLHPAPASTSSRADSVRRAVHS